MKSTSAGYRNFDDMTMTYYEYTPKDDVFCIVA